MNIHNMWRESKQLKDPDDCAVKQAHDCECNTYCKLSLYCDKHEGQDSECVDCAWDAARSMNDDVKWLHRSMVKHAIDAAKARRELSNLKNK
jgi:hypothetical protein